MAADYGYTRIPTANELERGRPGTDALLDQDYVFDSRRQDEVNTPSRRSVASRPSTPGARKSKMNRMVEKEADRISRWLDLAARGEMCAYTCFGLQCGARPWSRSVLDLIPVMITLLSLQVAVPGLLLVSVMREFRMFAQVQTQEFRIIGFILYLYSLRNMYHGALDECRKSFLDLAFHYNLSWGYILPMLLGEVVNSFAAFSLSVTLFLVFCNSWHPQDLIINCIAINFIGSVDTEFTDDEMMKRALLTFNETMDSVRGQEIGPESLGRALVEVSSKYLLLALRIVCTLGLGCLFAVLLAISHEEILCEATPLLCVENLCDIIPLLCMGEPED